MDRSFSFGAVWRAGLEVAILASMATYEYRVTEAADGTFPVELWSSQGDRSQLIYKTRGFQKPTCPSTAAGSSRQFCCEWLKDHTLPAARW
jgi:hypothetical protein